MEEDPSRRRQTPPEKKTPDHSSPSSVEVAVDGDPAMWGAFNERFKEVQTVLDRNRLLIEQVNENQQSRQRDNMVKNVSLIQELNGNISKVVSLYSDLNSNFSTAFQQHSTKDTGTSDSRDNS